MSMQVIASNLRVVIRPTMRTKIKRRLKEAVRLIVTRGAVVEESRRATPRVVSRPEESTRKSGLFRVRLPCLFCWGGGLAKLSADWTYIALPTTEMFCMPFMEQLGLMRKVLESIRRHVPGVEKTLRSGERQAPKSFVRRPSSRTSFCRSRKLPPGYEQELDLP